MSGTREPTLPEMLRRVIRAQLADVWTSLPGIVEKYDAAKQSANIQPAVKWRVEAIDGEELIELPVLTNVPIMHPSGGGFFAAFPLAKGDPVLLVFCARSADVWKASNGSAAVDPNDIRQHAFADAYAIPGGRPFKAPLGSASATDFVFGKDGGDALVTMKNDGSIIIGKDATKEAARKGDAVRVTIPANSFLVSCSGSPAVGVLNATPVDVDGEITEGSAKVKVVD